MSNFNGHTLIKDSQTGFLTHTKGHALNGFTLKKKVRFLKVLKKCWPNLSQALDAVQIARQTFYDHLHHDEGFHEAIEEIKERFLDHLESVMSARAAKDGGFMDRICLLRSYRPDRFAPKTQVSIQPSQATEELLNRLGEAYNRDRKVIEAKAITEEN